MKTSISRQFELRPRMAKWKKKKKSDDRREKNNTKERAINREIDTFFTRSSPYLRRFWIIKNWTARENDESVKKRVK